MVPAIEGEVIESVEVLQIRGEQTNSEGGLSFISLGAGGGYVEILPWY